MTTLFPLLAVAVLRLPRPPLGASQIAALAWVAGWLTGLLPAAPSLGVLRSLGRRRLVHTTDPKKRSAGQGAWTLTLPGLAVLRVLLAVGKLPAQGLPGYLLVTRPDTQGRSYAAVCAHCWREDVARWHPTRHAADMAAWFEGGWSLTLGCPACPGATAPAQPEPPRYQAAPLEGPRDGGYGAQTWAIASGEHYGVWLDHCPEMAREKAA